MPIAPPTVDELPPAPSRDMSDDDFVVTSNDFVAALPPHRDQLVDLGANVYANALDAESSAADAEAAQATAEGAAQTALGANTRSASSATSHSFTPGSKAFTMTETGRTFVHPMEVKVYRASDVDAAMYGSTSSVAGQVITIDVTSEGIVGSGGPYTDWRIVDAAFAETGATVDEERAGTSQFVASTPYSRVQEQDPQNLTAAATIAWSGNGGRNARVTLTGNQQIGAPTNLKDGLIYTLDINPATFTPTWDSIWDFTNIGGQPALAASAWTKIRAQYNADRTKLEVFAGPIRGYVQIAQATPAGASQIDFTSIPSTYSDLLIVADGLTQSTGGAIALNLAVSGDGVSFSSSVTMLSNWIAGSSQYGTIEVPGYRRAVGNARGVASTAPSAGGMSTTSNVLDAVWRMASGIQALRLSASSGNITGGTITLFARK